MSRLQFFKQPALDTFIHLLTGRVWHYQCVFRYTPDSANGSMNITRLVDFHVLNRNVLADKRVLKKELAPDFVRKLEKRFLKNGQLEATQLSSIGWFRPNKVTRQTGKIGHKKPWYAI